MGHWIFENKRKESAMKIIVLIKPVPDLTKLKVSRSKGQVFETGKRILNSWDRPALQLAVDLKKEHGGTINGISLCREEDSDVLREAFAMGADKCYQLTDPQFAGNDAYVNAIILSRAISKLEPYDLILCGAQSGIGFSGQTGPRIAEALNIPQATAVVSISVEKDSIIATSNMNGKTGNQKIKLPGLLTLDKSIREPKIPNALMIMKAYKKKIVIKNAKDLGFTSDEIGREGALTTVYSQYLAEMT
jgi:electron transfer flavoprotein beta subunit